MPIWTKKVTYGRELVIKEMIGAVQWSKDRDGDKLLPCLDHSNQTLGKGRGPAQFRGAPSPWLGGEAWYTNVDIDMWWDGKFVLSDHDFCISSIRSSHFILTSEEFEMLAYRTKFNEFFTVRYILPIVFKGCIVDKSMSIASGETLPKFISL